MTGSRWVRRAVAVVMVAGIAVGGTLPARAAGGKGHGAHFRFAWLANDPANAYDNAILAGIESAAARSRSSVDAFYAGFDPATQLEQCHDAVSSGSYDALIIIAASGTEIIPCVEEARAAGIPVAAVDLPIGDDATTVEPQVDGVVASSLVPAADFAAAIGGFVPDACAGLAPCDVFYLAGLVSFEQPIVDAIQAAADASPSISFAGHAEAFYDAGFAHVVMTQVLADHPEIDVVVTSDQMALGTEQAMNDAGVSVRIVGAGAGASSLEAVRQGRWLATLNALPYTEGRLVTGLLVRALRQPNAAPEGVHPIAASGLPTWWTAGTLAEHPEFLGEWPGP